MEYKRLGDIATYINGYAFKPSDRGEVGLPIIRIQDLTGNSYDLAYYNGAYPEKIEINNGDVLISWSASLGVYIWNNGKALLNQHIFKVVFDKIEVDKNYFVFAVQYYLKEMQRHAHGATMKHIIKKDFDNTRIPFPSLEQQENISKMLLKTKQLINAYQQEIDKLDNLVKARFVELFGGHERITTIARYITELRGGKSLAGTEPCKNKVLKTGAATFGWFDPEQYKYLPVDYEPLPEHKVETGDVIISRMNTPELVGACSYVFDAPKDMYYPDRLWKAMLKENTNPIFLWQLLWDRDIRKAIKESSGGTSGTMHNISKANLLAINCVDAPIELQNEYADFVKQIYKLKLG